MTPVAECDGSRNSNFVSALLMTVVWSGAMRLIFSLNWPRPAVQRLIDAKPAGDDGQLRHADEVDDTDQEQIAVGFLTDFLAQERSLQIG